MKMRPLLILAIVALLVATGCAASPFEHCDVVAMPTTPTPAFRLGEKTADPIQMYLGDVFTVSAKLTGLPAISLPAGRDGTLPIGVQLTGRMFDEATLLAAGRVLE